MDEQIAGARRAPYFRRHVEHAFETGAQLSVVLRGMPEGRFSGHVQDVADDCFSLTHIAELGAWRWSFAFDDLLTVGVRLPLPAESGLMPACSRHDSA